MKKKHFKELKESIKQAREGKLTRYKNINELMEHLKEEKNKTSWWKIYVYYPLCHWWDRVEEFPYKVRDFFMRGKRGWGYRDLWGFSSYIAQVMVGALTKLKEIKHGYPGEDEASTNAKWGKCLDDMIYTFKTVIKVLGENDETWLIPHEKEGWTPEWRTKTRNFVRRLNYGKKGGPFADLNQKYYIMSKKEWERYQRGWYLFQKFFYSLWD